MAEGKGFSFSLDGLEAMVSALDEFEEELERRLEETLTKLAVQIIHDAKRLSPFLEGELEVALIVGEVKRTIAGMYIDFGTSPEVDHYAVVQHEGFMHRNGKLVPLTPGEGTLSKGAYNGELPGKKFLERAIKMNEKRIIDDLSKVLGG